MKRAIRTLAALALFAALIGLTAPPGAQAQQPRFPEPAPQPQLVSIPGGGTELFRALLDKEGVQPVTLRELNNMFGAASDDLIVIAIGNPTAWDWNREPLVWVRRAIQTNGAALIASDYQFATHLSHETPGLHAPVAKFVGEIVVADWVGCHRQDSRCPYAVPVSPDELPNAPQKPGPVWNVFRGLTKLATNQPTYIEMQGDFRGEYQYPLARLPKTSATTLGMGLRSPLFAVGGDGPDQRWNGRPGYAFLAVADSSVYINQMIMAQGTDNLEFTLRTIEYLQGPQKHRKRCLFFENGRVIEKFDGLRGALAKPKPKIPPEAMPNLPRLLDRHQERLVDGANKLADRIQATDWLHTNLVGPEGSSRERMAFGKWVDIIAVVGAIFLALFLLSRTLRARHPLDVPPPPVTGAGAAATGPPGVFDRRQKELVRRNNLYEPVRNLMREFFDAVGAPPNPGPRLPTLEISDAVRKPESLRQAIRDMWRVAYGPPQPISAQRWFELEPYFDRLRKAHADGKWRFVTDGE
jgi:hypothetical protein